MPRVIDPRVAARLADEAGLARARIAPGSAPGTALRTPAKPPRYGNERPTRSSLLWRRQRRLVRPACLAIAGVVALAAVAGLVRTVQPGSAIATWRERLGGAVALHVHDVVIQGREKTPEAQLRAALGVGPGDRLLGFSLDAARTRIEQLAWVQGATVERRLPGTVVVTLNERRPFAVWQSSGRFVLIDRQGQVVAEQDPAKDATAFATLPLVVGQGAPEAAAPLLDAIAALPELKSRVVAAVRVGERRWNLRLHNGADILLPEGAEPAALARLMELQTSQQLLDRPLQTVDLRLGDRLVVRPAPDPRPNTPQGTGTRRPT